MKRLTLCLLAVLMTLALAACAIPKEYTEKIDKFTDDTINYLGEHASEAMEDVDVREVLGKAADLVDNVLEAIPQEEGASLGDTVKNMAGALTEGSIALISEASDIKVEKDGVYTSAEEVAAYLRKFKKLPENFITTEEAKKLGWDGEGDLYKIKEGASIGGDRYANLSGLLPTSKNRSWQQCDIGYTGGERNNKRLCYSNDGLYYYTEDKYETFVEIR